MPGGEHENMQAWSPEEDTIILEMHSQLGPMWSQIVRQLPGRTVSSVRNRWQRIAMLGGSARRETAWRSEAADDHARLLQQCFAGADHGPGAVRLTAQEEDRIWQEASSWKGYCEGLAGTAAARGHEACLRVLHELGGEAAASLAAADANGDTPAHYAADHEGAVAT